MRADAGCIDGPGGAGRGAGTGAAAGRLMSSSTMLRSTSTSSELAWTVAGDGALDGFAFAAIGAADSRSPITLLMSTSGAIGGGGSLTNGEGMCAGRLNCEVGGVHG